MNNKQAKEAISKQKIRFTEPNRNDETWLIQTASLIESIFGKDSNEYLFIYKFSFKLRGYHYDTQQDIRNRHKENETKLLVFLDNCIEMVDVKGIYKSKRANFLSNWDTPQLLGSIGASGLVIFGAGFFMGELSSKNMTSKLEDRIVILSDSLKSRGILPDSATHYQPAAKSKEKNNKIK